MFFSILQKLLLHNINNYHGNRTSYFKSITVYNFFCVFFNFFFFYNLLLINNNTFYCPSDIVYWHISNNIYTPIIYIYIIYILRNIFYTLVLIANIIYNVINNSIRINILYYIIIYKYVIKKLLVDSRDTRVIVYSHSYLIFWL